MSVRYCSKCVYPSSSAAPLTFDSDGVCSGCRVHSQVVDVDWDERLEMLHELVRPYRNQGKYDVIIPVSGGKDSYFQTHIATKVLNLKPLLVTYHANNYLPEGEENLFRMTEIFDCDHLVFRPSKSVLIKMNRLGLKVQGDMNWHAHCGIETMPIIAAVNYEVPLMFWGEHGFKDLGGMYSHSDFPEFTAKTRVEHGLRGYDWFDFTDDGLESLGCGEFKEGLTPNDLHWGKYPSDKEIDAVGVRGIYMDNYIPWDGEKNAELMMQLYDWRTARQPFERTYRAVSNLDDMHENGTHDYLKFVKFGYGRATDHACKDIRHGRFSRDEGIEKVQQYDHVKPYRDLNRWLEYTSMTEREFDIIADRFRDPNVWWIENGRWWKDNIWGEPSSYGDVIVRPSQFC